jgi:hypothetical protein
LPTLMKIPARYKPGILVLASLTEHQFIEVSDALKKVPPSPQDQRQLAAWVTPEVKSLGEKELSSLLETLSSLYRLRSKHDVSPEKLSHDVYAATRSDTDLRIEDERVPAFKERLAKFMAVDSLNVVFAKAKELQLETERTLCEARILTDLRPVFAGNVADSPTAMIILHTLKVGYHDTNFAEHKEMFIALDEDDIEKLKETLVRAQLKAKTLKSRLDAAGIRAIDFS